MTEPAFFRYDPHALERMQLRRISRRQVENTIKNPDRLRLDLERDRLIAERDTPHGNVLRVVYTMVLEADGTQGVYVITVIRIGRKGKR